MKRKHERSPNQKKSLISSIYNSIDYMAAVLLLTGQVTSTGVFVSPGGLWLSVTGPILGGRRLSGNSAASSLALDVVDVVTAILLILGQVTVTGPWISSGSFNLVISGPAFGVPSVPVPMTPSEATREFYGQFRPLVVTKFLSAEDEPNR